MNIFKTIAILLVAANIITAQIFEKEVDETNPIVSTRTDQNYSGAAWIDYNNDGLLDLFTSKSFLFKNLGNGNFEKIDTGIGEELDGNSNGITWADYDDDGDLDVFIAGRHSSLYKNNGNDEFIRVFHGDLNDGADIRGWAASWGDYDEDGFVDLVITHPKGFLGPNPTSNHLFHNNGGMLERVDSLAITNDLAPFTIASWTDYDLDGDLDLFIGSGPAGTAARDFIYSNNLIETSKTNFERITDLPFAEDRQDGQVWNWIDYDNDGDLDGFITNYGGASNKFYVNENGVYNSVSNALTIDGQKLANIWGDVDNDGDLDVVVTGDSDNDFYLNNGDGTFTSVDNDIAALTSISASFGDYDNDGDLDLFLSGAGDGKALFKNIIDNGNNWINIRLRGTVSNSSAIGAKVKLKAKINGKDTWQMREISAQNSFNGHNSLRVHFGLADAAAADSIIIYWPNGQMEVMENISANGFYTYTEPVPSQYFRANFNTKTYYYLGLPEVQFTDESFTDPGFPVTSWEWDFNNDGVVDATEKNPVYTYPAAGIYSVSLTVSNGLESKTRTKENFIEFIRTPGIPSITSLNQTFTDTTVQKGDEIKFIAEGKDTSEYQVMYEWFKDSQSVDKDSIYNYRASAFGAIPRTDTIKVVLSNGFYSVDHSWYIHVEEPTGIADETGIPKEFQLKQNYPNPFNPSTVIEYSLRENSIVKLNLYDILGRKIKSLVNESQSAGFYSLTINSNIDSRTLTSGIYFYRIEAEGSSGEKFVQTRKLTLIK